MCGNWKLSFQTLWRETVQKPPVVFPALAAPEGRCWPQGKAGNTTYSRLRKAQVQDIVSPAPRGTQYLEFSDTLAGG